MQRYFLFFDLCIENSEKRTDKMHKIRKNKKNKKYNYYLSDIKWFYNQILIY